MPDWVPADNWLAGFARTLFRVWTKRHGCEPSLRGVRNERRSNPLIFNEIASVVPPSQWQEECNSGVFVQILFIKLFCNSSINKGGSLPATILALDGEGISWWFCQSRRNFHQITVRLSLSKAYQRFLNDIILGGMDKLVCPWRALDYYKYKQYFQQVYLQFYCFMLFSLHGQTSLSMPPSLWRPHCISSFSSL